MMIIRKKLFFLLLRICVTAFLLCVLLTKIDFHHLLYVISHEKWGYIGLAAGTVLVARFLTYWRIWILLRIQDVVCRFWRLVGTYWICDFGAFFLPGLVGSDILRVIGLQSYAADYNKSISAVLVERFLGLFSLFGIALIGMRLGHFDFIPASALTLVTLLCLVGFLAFVLLSWKASRKGFSRLLTWGPVARLSFIRKFFDALGAYSNALPALLFVFLLSLGVQFMKALGNYYCALAVGIELSLDVFLLFIPIVFLAIFLPISLGGWGVREGAFVYLFLQVGVDPTDALAASFLNTLVNMTISLPGGGLYLRSGFFHPLRPAGDGKGPPPPGSTSCVTSGL